MVSRGAFSGVFAVASLFFALGVLLSAAKPSGAINVARRAMATSIRFDDIGKFLLRCINESFGNDDSNRVALMAIPVRIGRTILLKSTLLADWSGDASRQADP